MPITYSFRGTVWPGLTLAKFSCDFADEALGNGYHLDATLQARVVQVDCIAPVVVVETEMATLKHIVQRIVQDQLNAMALMGVGFHSLELTHVHWEETTAEFGQPGEVAIMSPLTMPAALALLGDPK
ncbi:MAG: hypothetical protein QOI63_1008, partial [Thermoplasmata archaeon]|nr:hypothetical protein [Thermoplasmata archaeon]